MRKHASGGPRDTISRQSQLILSYIKATHMIFLAHRKSPKRSSTFMPYLTRRPPAPPSDPGALHYSSSQSRQLGTTYDMLHASPHPYTSESSLCIPDFQGTPCTNLAPPTRSQYRRSISIPRPELSRTSRATRDDTRERGRCSSFSGSNLASIQVPVPEIDWASDRLARACGHMPTDFEKFNPTRTTQEVKATQAPRYPAQDPQKICNLLDQVLREEGLHLQDYFEVKDLTEGDTGEHDVEHYEMERVLTPKALLDGDTYVFGIALQDIACHAMSYVEFAGYMHELPTVVYSCVEELYRTGMYQDALFRTFPDSKRLLSLVSQFDLPSPYNLPPNLRHESTPTICSLLTMYLHAIPSPLIARRFYDALWDCCVKPSFMQASSSHVAPNLRKHAINVLEEEMSEAEKRQVNAAQYVLRMLPHMNLSLLVYLFGFFSQLPICLENGLTLEDISHIFAGRLLGGPRMHGTTLMVWLLHRWGKISEALFEDKPECVSSVEERQASVAGVEKIGHNVSAEIPTGPPEHTYEQMGPPQHMKPRPFLSSRERDRSSSMCTASSGSSWTSGSDVPVSLPFKIDDQKQGTDLCAVREIENESYEQSFIDTIHFQCRTPSEKLFSKFSFSSTTDTDTEDSPDEDPAIHMSLIAPDEVIPSDLAESLHLLFLVRHRTSVLAGQLEDTKLTVCDALEDTATVQRTAEARSTAQGDAAQVDVLKSAWDYTIDVAGGIEESSVAIQVARRLAAEKQNIDLRNRLEDALSERDEARAVMMNLRRIFEATR